MVVHAVDAFSSSHTVYLDKPLKVPRFVSLLSCTLYNSWHNLMETAKVSFPSKRKEFPIEPGHHTNETLGGARSELFWDEPNIGVRAHDVSGGMTIITHARLTVDRHLGALLGLGRGSGLDIAKTTHIPQAYLPHQPEETLHNGKPSAL